MVRSTIYAHGLFFILDDCTVLLLFIRILASYAGYVKHVLTSEQKKSDFRPSEGGDADLFSCTQVRLKSDPHLQLQDIAVENKLLQT